MRYIGINHLNGFSSYCWYTIFSLINLVYQKLIICWTFWIQKKDPHQSCQENLLPPCWPEDQDDFYKKDWDDLKAAAVAASDIDKHILNLHFNNLEQIVFLHPLIFCVLCNTTTQGQPKIQLWNIQTNGSIEFLQIYSFIEFV